MPVISQADCTLLGVFKLPQNVDFGGGNVQSTSWGSGPLAFRRVGSEKRFFSTAWFGSLVYEASHPGTLGADLATAPTATVVKAWGDIFGNLTPVAPNSSGGNRYRGLTWSPGDGSLPAGLLVSFGAYYSGDLDWPSLALIGISGDVATPIGNWKTAVYGFNYRANGSVLMPDGRIALTGGGNKGAGISLGPSLFAMTTANMAAATPTTNTTSPPNGTNTAYTQLLLYDQGTIALNAPPYVGPQPARRDADYRPALFGDLDQNALSTTLVYLPVASTYQIDDHYAGRNHTIRGETKLCTLFVGATRLATFSSPFSFVPVTGDAWEIDLSGDPAFAGFGVWTPQPPVGYFTNLEYVGQPVWIEGANKQGLLCPVDMLKGRAHYAPGGLHQESRKRAVLVYDPADLDGSAGIDWVNSIDLEALGIPDPGRGGSVAGEPREINFAWDPVDSILYVLDNFAWNSGSEYNPAVWAIAVNLGAPPPALHDRILEAVVAKLQSLAIAGLAGVHLNKFPSVDKIDGPCLIVTYFGEAEEMMGGDRAADEIGFPVLVYQDGPTLVEEETRPQELLWRGQVSDALRGQRLAGVPEVVNCIVEPRAILEQGSETLTRTPQDVAARMRSGMLFRFVARVARGGVTVVDVEVG